MMYMNDSSISVYRSYQEYNEIQKANFNNYKTVKLSDNQALLLFTFDLM